MGTYRKEWDCCGSVTETQAWEPEECPFCATPPSPSTAPTQQDRVNVLPPFAAPAGQQEVTRLDLLSLIHSQCYRVYASAIDREEIDTKYMAEIEDALKAVYADAEVARRCRAQGGNTSAESVESGTAPTVEVDEDIRIARHAVFNLKEFRAGRTTFPGEALGILERCFDRLASKPPAREAAERQSIDTPEFSNLAHQLYMAGVCGGGQIGITRALIAHIDTWGGAAPAAGNIDKPKEDP